MIAASGSSPLLAGADTRAVVPCTREGIGLRTPLSRGSFDPDLAAMLRAAGGGCARGVNPDLSTDRNRRSGRAAAPPALG